MPPRTSSTKSFGFTLVELLIVVAIIGVMASIGIPVYKRYLQRAHKAEAKLNLGRLYQMETGFFQEWGGYGGRLDAIGYETETPPRYYTIGFVTNTCTGIPDLPNSSTLIGQGIMAKFPSYYNNYTADKSFYGVSFINECHASTMPPDGSSFIATATGRLAGFLGDNPPLSDLDLWQINDQKVISNVQDGTH